MPGDISKHTKYIVNEPYPEVKVEGKNVYYANLLLDDFAGMISEMTAVSLYVYQHIVSKGKYKDYSEVIGGISMAEMKHMELLGETIRLLGCKPIYSNSVCPCGKIWSANYVNFDDAILNMIEEDIKSEEAAIKQYMQHICLINDKYIKRLLNRIILDEKLHMKYFKKLYKKYSKCDC